MAKFDTTLPLKDKTYEEARFKNLQSHWDDINPNGYAYTVHEEKIRLQIKQKVEMKLPMGGRTW
jgi:hypothetical protein